MTVGVCNRTSKQESGRPLVGGLRNQVNSTLRQINVFGQKGGTKWGEPCLGQWVAMYAILGRHLTLGNGTPTPPHQTPTYTDALRCFTVHLAPNSGNPAMEQQRWGFIPGLLSDSVRDIPPPQVRDQRHAAQYRVAHVLAPDGRAHQGARASPPPSPPLLSLKVAPDTKKHSACCMGRISAGLGGSLLPDGGTGLFRCAPSG